MRRLRPRALKPGLTPGPQALLRPLEGPAEPALVAQMKTLGAVEPSGTVAVGGRTTALRGGPMLLSPEKKVQWRDRHEVSQ